MGGLAGGNDGWISNTYAWGNVTGKEAVGGLVGDNDEGFIEKSYSVGKVSGTTNVGGFVGLNDGGIEDSYWNNETAGVLIGVGSGSSEGVTGKDTQLMKLKSTFLTDHGIDDWYGWDFVGPEGGPEDIWDIADGITYPRLTMSGGMGGGGDEP